MKKTGNAKFLTALIIFSLTGQIAWVVENMYFNVFIYKMFNAFINILWIFINPSFSGEVCYLTIM